MRHLILVLAFLIVLAPAVACGAAGERVESTDQAAEAPSEEPAADVEVVEVDDGDSGPIRGIDISHYSGEVDWKEVEAAGFRFAYVKASEGVDNPDPKFAQHWQELAATDLHRGAYHLYVTEDDPEAQAKLFLSATDLGPGDLLPVVDIELLGRNTPPGLPDRLRRFLEILEQEIGAKPMIYTGPNFWDQHIAEDFGEYRLWLSEVGTSEPRIPTGWSEWTAWQWEINTRVPGVEKDVDVSRVHPDVGLEELLIP